LFKIVCKKQLNDQVVLIKFDAPLIAQKAKAGQFIIFRIDEYGERVPLTIADTDKDNGTITIIFQVVGSSTQMLSELNEGDSILDLVGPLGRPTEVEGVKKAIVVGGGVGCAIAFPVAKALHEQGAKVDVIAGFRNRDIVILEDEFKAVSDTLTITTDDGSYGTKGFVTDALKAILDKDSDYDLVVAIGPVPMMKFVSLTTKPYAVKTLVSLNPIMIDGTGMCGGCRVTVGGEIKFACVDGPDFDGHLVDFDELMLRNRFYKKQEEHNSQHHCRLFGGANNG